MKHAMEILYWSAIIVTAGVALWKHRRTPANIEFKRGKNDGRSYLDAGVLPASILSYVERQRSMGMSGPYETGLQEALKTRVLSQENVG